MANEITIFAILIISFILSIPVYKLIRRLFFSEWDYLKEDFFWSSANVFVRKITVWVMIFITVWVMIFILCNSSLF